MREKLPDMFAPSGRVENVAPELIEVAEAGLELDVVVDVVEVVVGDVVFIGDAVLIGDVVLTTAMLVIVDGVAVMSNVLWVGVTALLLFAHTENMAVAFDLDA